MSRLTHPSPNANRNTALHLAAAYKSTEELLATLTANPSLLNQTNMQGHTPLVMAIKMKKFDNAKALIKAEAKITTAAINFAELFDAPEDLLKLLEEGPAKVSELRP